MICFTLLNELFAYLYLAVGSELRLSLLLMVVVKVGEQLAKKKQNGKLKEAKRLCSTEGNFRVVDYSQWIGQY